MLDSENSIREIPRENIESIRLIRETQPIPDTQVNLHPEHTQAAELAKEPVHDVSPHGALFQSEQRQLLHREIEALRRRIERIGAPYRISGGILTGVGSLVAFSALTSLAVSGTHHEYYGYYGYSSDGSSREDLRTGAITAAVVGAGITAAGVVLIVTANTKRRRALKAHNQDFSYTLSPHIYHPGAGASLRMQF